MKKVFNYKVKEFELLPFKREEEYFNDGYASWEITYKNKKWQVFANYDSASLLKNGETKNALNGITSFELWNYKNQLVKKFKATDLVVDNELRLKGIEEYLIERLG